MKRFDITGYSTQIRTNDQSVELTEQNTWFWSFKIGKASKARILVQYITLGRSSGVLRSSLSSICNFDDRGKSARSWLEVCCENSGLKMKDLQLTFVNLHSFTHMHYLYCEEFESVMVVEGRNLGAWHMMFLVLLPPCSKTLTVLSLAPQDTSRTHFTT